jgi:hypothetical protein
MSNWVQNAGYLELSESFYDMAVRRDGNVPESASSHVRRCGSCRARVTRLRKAARKGEGPAGGRQFESDAVKVLDSHFQCLDVPVTCSRARPFLPGLATSCLDLRIPTPITVHVDHCPQCAADLAVLKGLGLSDEQLGSVGRLYERTCSGKGRFWRRNAARDDSLPQAVYAIAERPDSGLATTCRMVDEGQKVVAAPGDPYADYPIRVEIAHRTAPPTDSCGRVVLRPLVRRFSKPIVAAVAVLVLAALFFCTQSTSGVALGEVVRAFERARNIHVVGLHPVSGEVIYEIWVSRDLKLLGMVRGEECVVYDLATGEKEDLVAERVSRIDDAAMGRVRAMADACLGFSPSSVPANAAWMRSFGDGKREVYELMWTEQTYGGRDVLIKREFVVDPTTGLPVSVRRFYWDALGKEWECASVMVLDYLPWAGMGGAATGQSVVRTK